MIKFIEYYMPSIVISTLHSSSYSFLRILHEVNTVSNSI